MVLECPGCSRKEHTPGQPEHPEDALDRGYTHLLGLSCRLAFILHKSLVQGSIGFSFYCRQGRSHAVRRCKIFNTLFKKLNCPGAFDWWCPWQHAWFSGVSSCGFWAPKKQRRGGGVAGRRWGEPATGRTGWEAREPICFAWLSGWACSRAE